MGSAFIFKLSQQQQKKRKRFANHVFFPLNLYLFLQLCYISDHEFCFLFLLFFFTFNSDKKIQPFVYLCIYFFNTLYNHFQFYPEIFLYYPFIKQLLHNCNQINSVKHTFFYFVMTTLIFLRHLQASVNSLTIKLKHIIF